MAPVDSEHDQRCCWQQAYRDDPFFFGEQASGFAQLVLPFFLRFRVASVLELGCGQGRDSLWFARQQFHVTAVDYAETALQALEQQAARLGVAAKIQTRPVDVRAPLPLTTETFDACYAHMLLCMDLSRVEIGALLTEVHRLLRPGGVLAYSVRSCHDPHYGQGLHLGEGRYQLGPFRVHFFTPDLIEQLADGFELLDVQRLTEGRLPRDLWCVRMKKNGVRRHDLLPEEEGRDKSPAVVHPRPDAPDCGET